MTVKQLLLHLSHAAGLHVTRFHKETDLSGCRQMGRDAANDIALLLESRPNPVVFDVGANVGQSVHNYRRLLPTSSIYSFEPSVSAFRQLEANTAGLNRVHLANVGVGAKTGTQDLFENESSDMNSYLRPDDVQWGKLVGTVPTDMTTLDDYCELHVIDHIDLLKIDTQGYELEVLKGASGLLGSNRISIVYMEVIFSRMYDGIPSFDEVYRFMLDRGFRLVAFYRFYMRDRVADWSDALFVNRLA